MEDIQYVGEHLLPGNIGHFGIVTAFVASLLAALSYFFATRRRDEPEAATWRQMGRGAFAAHGISIFVTIGVMFYLMINQYYEYQYVWAHVSDDLPFKYIFSAFWEGQEGSFLLWLFWHVVLGFVLIGTAKKWESPVMTVLSLIQALLVSMILGIYLGVGEEAVKIGSNPLLLLRDAMDAPIFRQADYLELISGNGLNPLLQNYWMTIHPPTLFLGFASTAIPFAYAIAGLWTGQHKEWLRPALPWALFSAAILGIGILMGGAWAYEALSFGGYWAWDPVENMSLVPWLILIAGLHTHLVARSTGHSIRSTYVFYLLTFLLIAYSTFLTRSGVLGDTSVHAFTEMGLEWQLVGFIVVFLLMSAALLGWRYRSIPAPKREESLSSKEFWMFIGSLVLLFSALLITASTSLPVYNKIMQWFDPAFEGSVITDPEPHYNKYQLWIGVFIGLLSGVAQYLRFRESNFPRHRKRFLTHTLGALAAAGLMTWLTSLWIEVPGFARLTLLLFAWFTVLANLDYLVAFTRTNLRMAGSVLSHVGFGLMVVGILASGLNKQFLSSNPFVMEGLIEGASEESLRNNILLFQDEPMQMGPYEVTYTRDTIDKFTRTYTVEYVRRNEEGEIVESFELKPNVLYDKSYTKIAASNPATKHYLEKDIFTHIASLPQVEMDFDLKRRKEDSLNYRRLLLPLGEQVRFTDSTAQNSNGSASPRTYAVYLESINRQPSHPDYLPQPNDLALGARLALQRQGDEEVLYAEPVIVIRDQFLYQYPAQVKAWNMKVRLSEAAFDAYYVPEDELDYSSFSLKQGDKVNYRGYELTFTGYNKNPRHPGYEAQDEDIAVSALISVTAPDGRQYLAEPVYLIRENRPFNLKDQIDALGLHLRFERLDPADGSMTLRVAQTETLSPEVPVEIATDALRSDYIVLEAILFPGINLFWLGSTLMMAGLLFSFFNRLGRRRARSLA